MSELESQQAQFFFLAFFSQLYKVTFILKLWWSSQHLFLHFAVQIYEIHIYIIDNKNNTIVL